MEEKERKKKLLTFSKEELIKKILNKDKDDKLKDINIKEKYEKKYLKQFKANESLKKYISKFRQVSDKFGVKKGAHIFVEYRSELKDVRTARGYFIEESKTHIKVKVKDSKNNYFYHIKKKLINGVKEYYEISKYK